MIRNGILSKELLNISSMLSKNISIKTKIKRKAICLPMVKLLRLTGTFICQYQNRLTRSRRTHVNGVLLSIYQNQIDQTLKSFTKIAEMESYGMMIHKSQVAKLLKNIVVMITHVRRLL